MEEVNEDNLADVMNSILEAKSVNIPEDLEDTIDSEPTSDIDLSTEFPYVIFNREDLLQAMNLASSIVLSKSDNIVYNSITFVPVREFNTLIMLATNELSLLRYKAELLGDMNETIDSKFSISLLTLQKIIRLMGNKVLFYIKENNLYVRLLDGDLCLDLRRPDDKLLSVPGELSDKLAELKLENIGSIVASTLPLMNTEIRGDSRKVSFDGEKAYYQSPFYYLESKVKTPPLVLKNRDAEFISKLYNNKNYRDKTMILHKMTSNLNRIYLSIANIDYIFISGNASQSNLMSSQLDRILKEVEAEVEYDRISRLVSLAVNLPNSTGIITFEFSDKDLRVTLSSNRGDSVFILNIDKRTDYLYRKPISIKAEPFKKLLNAFDNPDKIGIAFTDYSIVLEKNGVKAALMNIT